MGTELDHLGRVTNCMLAHAQQLDKMGFACWWGCEDTRLWAVPPCTDATAALTHLPWCCGCCAMQNWAREFKQWCPHMRVLMYHGKERDQVRDHAPPCTAFVCAPMHRSARLNRAQFSRL